MARFLSFAKNIGKILDYHAGGFFKFRLEYGTRVTHLLSEVADRTSQSLIIRPESFIEGFVQESYPFKRGNRFITQILGKDFAIELHIVIDDKQAKVFLILKIIIE